MTYNQAINLIHSLSGVKYSPSLCRMEALMPYLSDIHKKMKFIHVAGTNGKGSVGTMLADILTASGYKTGLFTSPYVECFGERIRINGLSVPGDILAEYTDRLNRIMTRNRLCLNEFEFITALALMWFYDEKCDVSVLEVGLGGEFDPTNIIPQSLFSVITSISLDHTNILGNTVESIAKSKGKIAKPDGRLIINSAMPPEAINVIKNIAARQGTKLITADAEDISVRYGKTGSTVCADGQEYRISILGRAQPINLISVLEGIKLLKEQGFNISENILKKSVFETRLAARMERFMCAGKEVILDSGHNTESIRNLVSSVRLHGFRLPATVVFTSMADKEYKSIIRILSEISDRIIFTHADTCRCELAENLDRDAQGYDWDRLVCNDPKEAVKKALQGKNQTVLICGSFYLAGEVRKLFTETQ